MINIGRPTPSNLPAVILAGGLSRRMGHSKATTHLAGKPMLDHIIERLLPQVSALAINSHDGTLHADLPHIADAMPEHPGPLAGIAAAMRFARHTSQARHVLTAPVDTPFLPHDLGKHLCSALQTDDSIVLARSGGRTHPVVGLWPTSLEDQIIAWLEVPQNRKLMVFLQNLPVIEVDFAEIDTAIGPLDPFFNVNTPDDLARAELYLKALPS
ncbi:molybdopterin-guanine dinucleotide biosynthesis protein A [Agrobacterium vitis]|nr:molybdopterin-guanine dinucleotide biosynthesis protein A [Agrobacterium vitis]MBE1438402.1 molybdopterin-guanine dinucleotide biosynthesis protein A [Agrobacterium vitis]